MASDYEAFEQEYLEIPGYPVGRRFHIGNHVRRDLIVAPAWPHRGQPVELEQDVALYPLWFPSFPAAGDTLYVEVGLTSTAPEPRRAGDDFRALLFLADDTGALHSWDIAPGYDWLFPREWRPGEVFVGKLHLDLPDHLKPGEYHVGMVVFSASGAVLAPQGTPPATAPYMAHGEVLFQGTVALLTPDARDAEAAQDLNAALGQAQDGECEAAQLTWRHAQWHHAGDKEWASSHRPDVLRALANCFAGRADAAKDRSKAIADLIRARELDHWAPEYRKRARPLSRALYAEGVAAKEAEDWETAYRRFADAVAVDRSQSWARRYAEEARGHRLGIDKATLAERKREREEKRAQAKRMREDARRQALEAKREKALKGLRRPSGEEP